MLTKPLAWTLEGLHVHMKWMVRSWTHLWKLIQPPGTHTKRKWGSSFPGGTPWSMGSRTAQLLLVNCCNQNRESVSRKGGKIAQQLSDCQGSEWALLSLRFWFIRNVSFFMFKIHTMKWVGVWCFFQLKWTMSAECHTCVESWFRGSQARPHVVVTKLLRGILELLSII